MNTPAHPASRRSSSRHAGAWWRYPLAFLAGVLNVGAFAPFGFGVLAILAPAVLFALLAARRPGEAFRLGWAYGAGLMGFGVFWLRISIAQFGGLNLPLAVLVTLVFALAMAAFYGFAAWAGLRLGRGRPLPTLLLTLPAAWVAAEWVRGWFLTGFPWLALGYSQIDLPSAALAPLLGTYGVSLLVVVTAGCLAAWRRRWPPLAAAGLWLAVAGSDSLAWSRASGPPFEASILQGNIEQTLKWRPERMRATLDVYLGLTEQASASRLIIWPETAVPAFAHQVEDDLLEPLDAWARARGQDVVIGIPVRERDGSYYNALVNLGASGRNRYDKRHLVPFGEFMPLRPLLVPLAEMFAIPMSNFSPGRAERPLLVTAGLTAGASICYEDAFGGEVAEALPEAAFLINASNDAWFGDSLAPHQHLEIARMRARETDRYLLRATNTGVSAVIDPRGRLAGVAPQFTQAVLTGQVTPRQGRTPYVHFGDWPVVLLAFGMLAAGGWLARRPQTL